MVMGGGVDTGLMQNTCLHSGLFQEHQAILYPTPSPSSHIGRGSECYGVTQPNIGGVSIMIGIQFHFH